MKDTIYRQDAIDALAAAMPSLTTPDGSGEFDHDIQVTDEAYVDCMQIIHDLPSVQQWIPCSERLPKEYGEYRITWVTSYSPSKRFLGDSEYEVTSVWDEERKDFKGEWLLDDYIKHYPDVKVIAWKPLEEPYKGGTEWLI